MPKTSKFSLKPTAGYVVVEPVETERRTASGIVLPETHEEKPQMGKVLAIGPDQITDSGVKKPAPCQLGETVYYKQWGGNEVKFEDKDYLLVKFDDILAIAE